MKLHFGMITVDFDAPPGDHPLDMPGDEESFQAASDQQSVTHIARDVGRGGALITPLSLDPRSKSDRAARRQSSLAPNSLVVAS